MVLLENLIKLLQGTSYMPDLENKILFLEDDDLVGDTVLFECDKNNITEKF